MEASPPRPAALATRIYKKSRGHTDRDALLDLQRPVGDGNLVVPVMLDGTTCTPEQIVRDVYDRNHAFALAKRYREALADIDDLAREYGTTLDTLVDPSADLAKNLETLRTQIGTTVPTTDPLLLTPYAKLSMVELQAAADARVATLHVESSLRYDNQDGARYACNCYAADYLQFHGDKPYLPRVWWTREGKQKLQAGATEFGRGDYFALNSDDLNRWFHKESQRFGWVKVDENDINQAQASANAGRAVIASGHGVTEPGHIVNFAPEDEHNGILADRRNGKIVENGFVRSQAGAVNVGRAVSYQCTNVFDSDHENAGIWRYDPTLDESLGVAAVNVG